MSNEETPRRHLTSLVIGVLLSAIMIVPSVRNSTPSEFNIFFHGVLLGTLSSPFIIIYLISRSRFLPTAAVTTVAVLFSLCHAYLVYLCYAYKPHEVGYAGLMLAPPLEAVVVVPIAIIVIVTSNNPRRK